MGDDILVSGLNGTSGGKSPQQRSLWVSKKEHVIRIKNEAVHYGLDFYIRKLPEKLRQPPTEFMPETWRIGLHNREHLVISGSESLKLSLVAQYKFANDEDGIRRFCEAVVPHPTSMLICYGLYGIEPKLDDEEIKEVLAFDALYLATTIDMEFEPEFKRLRRSVYCDDSNQWLFSSIYNDLDGLVCGDLCKMENQIPFVLIKRAIKHIKKREDPSYKDEDQPVTVANGEQVEECASVKQTQVPALKEACIKKIMKCFMRHSSTRHDDAKLAKRFSIDANTPYLEQWMRNAVSYGVESFMDITEEFYMNSNAKVKLSQCNHILHAAYISICGADGTNRTPDWEPRTVQLIHVPSATKLKQSGIKILGVAGPLCTMSYDKRTNQLLLPKMNMFDDTVSVIRNIARYEQQCQYRKCMFHDYIYFMLDLVDTAEDFKFLSTKCGVISNHCGSTAFEKFCALNENLQVLPSSKIHNVMKAAINKRYNHRRYRIWSEFKTLFLSRPWLTLSAIAAILVTVATLIQTYAAVINSPDMKAHFHGQ